MTFGLEPAGRRAAKRIAHARVALLDGAEHPPHFEQAANITAFVVNFSRTEKADPAS
jgi:pimeloyl-ACP methyl ester carboxylesterase